VALNGCIHHSCLIHCDPSNNRGYPRRFLTMLDNEDVQMSHTQTSTKPDQRRTLVVFLVSSNRTSSANRQRPTQHLYQRIQACARYLP